MNTNDVVEMIDAISEGRNYDLEIKGANDTGECRLQFASNSFSLSLLEGWATEIDDPRTAREIAGALVAWANRKDGKPPHVVNIDRVIPDYERDYLD